MLALLTLWLELLMSVVSETRYAVDLNKVPARIDLYTQLIQAAEPLFNLDGKSLEDACKNHAQDLMFYDLMLQECKSIEDTVRSRIEVIEAELYRKYLETGSRALNSREIPQYIKGDQRYTDAYAILLEVVHVKRQLEAIVEALKSLGWSLNNIVKLRIAQLDHITL